MKIATFNFLGGRSLICQNEFVKESITQHRVLRNMIVGQWLTKLVNFVQQKRAYARGSFYAQIFDDLMNVTARFGVMKTKWGH